MALPVCSQSLVVQGLTKAAADLPFPMRGIGTDNDRAFVTVFDYCCGRGLELTRSRAYKKNDQAWVEQKNGSFVRRLVGYGRLSGVPATHALAELYAVSRLYLNFFQPSFKLKAKRRDARPTTRPRRLVTTCWHWKRLTQRSNPRGYALRSPESRGIASGCPSRPMCVGRSRGSRRGRRMRTGATSSHLFGKPHNSVAEW